MKFLITGANGFVGKPLCAELLRQGHSVRAAVRGFESDADHKKFYDAEALRSLDERWLLLSLFSTPFLFTSERLSKSVRQYCLVATYKKI